MENTNDTLSKEQVERYCRQMILPEILTKNQLIISESKVLVIGAGGLGSSCLMYLAGSGVGTIGIVDGDIVEISNLHRQVIHKSSNKGKNKALSASEYLKEYNNLVNIIPYETRLTSKNAYEISRDYDIIIDCTDNATTRYLINDIAVLLNIPFVSGSAIRYQGQLTVYVTNEIKNKCKGKVGCYKCLFPEPSPSIAIGSCNEEGVFSPVPGTIGILEATEALKILINQTEGILTDKLLFYDSLEMKFRIIKLKGKRDNCSSCGINSKLSREYIEQFDYIEFTNPQSCQVSKKCPLEDKYNITWKSLLDNNEEKRILDVRSREQFDICRINKLNSLNIPLEDLNRKDVKELESLFKKEENIFILCRSGNKSTYAADYLLKQGYKNVYNVVGGVHSYIKEIDNSIPYY